MAIYYVKGQSGTFGSGTARLHWSNSQTFAVGDIVAPSVAYATAAARRFVYECTTAGTGGASEPVWDYATPGTSTTISGDAIFTCRDITSWQYAAVYLNQAVEKSTVAGDIILVSHTTIDILGADTTYSIAANDVSIISVDESTGQPTIMDTSLSGGYIGHLSSNRSITINSTNRKTYFYGLLLLVSGSTADNILLNGDDGGHQVYEKCMLKQKNTGANLKIGTTGDDQTYTKLIDCELTLDSSSRSIEIGGIVEMEGCYTAGAAFITTLITPSVSADGSGITFSAVRCNFSQAVSAVVTILGNSSVCPFIARFVECIFRSDTITNNYIATQTHLNLSSTQLYIVNCYLANGNQYFKFLYANPLGRVYSHPNISIRIDTNETEYSWVIATTDAPTFTIPFETPYIDFYNVNTSTAIQPYFEIISDGSASAAKNDEIWAVFNFPQGEYSDRKSLKDFIDGTQGQDQASSTTEWVDYPTTYWKGKCDSGTSVTPSRIGIIRGKICIAKPNASYYVHPFIRT